MSNSFLDSSSFSSQRHQMTALFSRPYRYLSWRKLWIALAEGQQELGLPIRPEQIREMKKALEDIPQELLELHECRVEEEVLLHLKAFGEQCPLARPILNWGAATTFVSDNTILMQMYKGLGILLQELVHILRTLSSLAEEYKDLPCLGYAHGMAASLTTMGKRICLWLQDFLVDTKQMEVRLSHFQFLGNKGSLGTQETLMQLFQRDGSKVKALELRIAQKMGFSHLFVITGHSYPRKQDRLILQTLGNVGMSAQKMATDIRLLSQKGEIVEPSPWGPSTSMHPSSSLTEVLSAQTHYLISLTENPSHALAAGWLEYSTDDAVHHAKTLSHAFLSCHDVLELTAYLVEHMIIQPDRVSRHMAEHLPFLASEAILSHAIQKGGDRQDLQQRLRLYTQTALQEMQRRGPPNPLLKMVLEDPYFLLSEQEVDPFLIPSQYTGQSAAQVHQFLAHEVHSLLSKYQSVPPTGNSIR